MPFMSSAFEISSSSWPPAALCLKAFYDSVFFLKLGNGCFAFSAMSPMPDLSAEAVFFNRLLIAVEKLEHSRAGHGLDTAHSRRHRGFRNDSEKTDFRGVGYMGSAAKLGGKVPGLYDSYHVAVLFLRKAPLRPSFWPLQWAFPL